MLYSHISAFAFGWSEVQLSIYVCMILFSEGGGQERHTTDNIKFNARLFGMWLHYRQCWWKNESREREENGQQQREKCSAPFSVDKWLQPIRCGFVATRLNCVYLSLGRRGYLYLVRFSAAVILTICLSLIVVGCPENKNLPLDALYLMDMFDVGIYPICNQ